MHPSKIHIFILSGRSGAGKSTVAYEICHQLRQPAHNIPHVYIEGDSLDFIHPPEPQGNPKLMLANLRALLHNFYTLRRRSCGVLLISGTSMVLEWEAITNAVRDVYRSVDGKDHSRVVVRGIILTASNETAEKRLRDREIGTDLERHLASSKRMAVILERFAEESTLLPVTRVKTDDRDVSSIANDIVAVVTTDSKNEIG